MNSRTLIPIWTAVDYRGKLTEITFNSSLTSFLSHFQIFVLTITEKPPAVSVLKLPVFLYFFPIFPSHFYIISNFVYSSGFGFSSWSFSLHFFVCSIFIGILSSLIHIICSYHLNCYFECNFLYHPPLVSNSC